MTNDLIPFSNKLLLSNQEAATALGCGLSMIYELRNANVLEVVYLGGKSQITAESVRRVAREGWNAKRNRVPPVRRGSRGCRAPAHDDDLPPAAEMQKAGQ